MDKKVPKEVTLSCLETIIENKAEFKKWANFEHIEIMEIEGFIPDMSDSEYKAQLTARMKDRIEFLESKKESEGGFNIVPEDAIEAIKKVVSEL